MTYTRIGYGNSAEITRGWIVLTLTILFSVLNVCLGFALAVYLGYGPNEFFRSAYVETIGRSQSMPRSPAELTAVANSDDRPETAT